jgi:ribosomal protein S18 acetylase RimI-like enzyme
LTRPLDLDDLEHYLEFFVVQSGESGADGDPYYGPYGRDEPFVIDEVRERTRERWTKSLATPGWRRAWGGVDGDLLVGSANVVGDDLAAGLHRVTLGMGILHGYRRQGIGTRLLDRAIEWCRGEPSIVWLDLGVFGDNLPAQALYRKSGFEEIGETPDRWRIDGHRIVQIEMTLRVD